MKKPTGHTGRRTFTSIAMNSDNADAVATAVATGHRDPKSLMTYTTPGPGLKMKAARAVGKAVAHSSSSSSTLGKRVWASIEDEDGDYDEDKEVEGGDEGDDM